MEARSRHLPRRFRAEATFGSAVLILNCHRESFPPKNQTPQKGVRPRSRITFLGPAPTRKTRAIFLDSLTLDERATLLFCLVSLSQGLDVRKERKDREWFK
ncbi:hypothetical protein K469DRAFT_166996 [Zopfia rhizophila CBS 207.26]|uniref:Uncharacterized protein n=1 Tax=Zopfia rhizophila CBS 207.26 TaxID=1314779 RepID=A0A6A6E0S6_9PEZI|nr:hypothetical protein K469DRAFT_166996 [Zopfia rhizophila CBS 207.26]